MKRFSEQLHTKSKSVKLRAAERAELRDRVVSYMEYHPLPKEMKQQGAVASPFQTEAYQMVRIPFAMLAKWSAAAAVLLLVIVPVMAERAVPGDGLYAVKVRFNEEIRASFANTPYEKIEWETERLNRRIAEARLLANEGRLTEEVEAEVAEAVKQHTENAQREIEALRAEDEEEATIASIALNTTLEVQSASLRGEDNATELFGDDSHEKTKLLANVLDETISKQEASNASSTVPGYDKLMARVEMNTTRAHELLASLELDQESDQYKDITRRIQDIERSIAEAIELREADDQGARKVLVDSLQRTQRLIVLMTELEVSFSTDVEEIVPVILTPEEEAEQVSGYRQEVKKQIEIIEAALELNTKTELEEKALYSLGLLKEADVKLASTTEFTEIKTIAEDALQLGLETMATLEEYIVEIPAATSTPETDEDVADENSEEDVTEEVSEEEIVEEPASTTTAELNV